MSVSCAILGTRIDLVTQEEAVRIIIAMQKKDEQHIITTPNPEILLHAYHDQTFQCILNNASLNIPDGIGLSFALYLKGRRMRERVTGVDTAFRICKDARKLGWEIGIFGGREGTERFQKVSPCPIRVWKETDDIIRENPRLDILFVALGAPRQEYWMHKNLPRLASVKIGMAVGGAFDMLSGHIQRAPAWMRKAGLEWLWRLYREPWRTPRAFRSVILFPLTVLLREKRVW